MIKKLHPRAVWLFLVAALLRLSIVPVFVGLYLVLLLPEPALANDEFYTNIVQAMYQTLILWLAASIVWGYLHYRSYGYRLLGSGFEKTAGVFVKRTVTIPFENIRDIEIDRGVLARALRLAEIQIDTGGIHRAAEGRLPGLDAGEAETLKNELLQKSREAKTRLR